MARERVRDIAPFVKSLSIDGRNITINYDSDIIRNDEALTNSDGVFDGKAWSDNFTLLIDSVKKVASVLLSYHIEPRVNTAGYTAIEALNDGKSVRSQKENVKLSEADLKNIVNNINRQIDVIRSNEYYRTYDFSQSAAL